MIWNDFQSGTSSFHLHIFLCIWLHDINLTFYSSMLFWNESIPVFNLNWNSFWYKISFWYNVNWKRKKKIANLNWKRKKNCKSCGLEHVVHPYLIWCEQELFRLSHSILSGECNTNLTLERNSLQSESHFGIIWTVSKYKKTIHACFLSCELWITEYTNLKH